MNCGCAECLRKEVEECKNVGSSEDSFEDGSKEDANNVEMVAVQHHQREDALPFECSKCNLRFITESRLQMHSSVHNADVINFKCDFCKKYFGDKSSLDKHTTVHSKPLILTCTICIKQFNRSKNYHRYMAQVHSDGEKNCDQSIQNHEKSCAVHQKIYWCTWKGCRFTGETGEYVVAHVGAIHFVEPRNELLKMETAEVDIDKFVRKVPPSVAARRRLVKTKKSTIHVNYFNSTN